MDLESLKSQAITIRDERERSANTATRVGRALLDTVNAVEENNTAIVAANANIATNAANIATANANIATNKANIEQLQAFYHGDLGNHASWTDAQSRLDLMATDGSQSGQYQLSVGAVPFIAIHTNVNYTSKIFTQTIIGSAFINSQTGTLQTAHNVAANIFSRTYASGQWGAWVRLAAMSDVPKPQENAEGYKEVYVYSHLSDPTRFVMSGVGGLFQNNGGLKLRMKVWGSGNKQYDDGKYVTFDCPQVTTGGDGAMNHEVYGRIINNTIYENGSTTTAVKIKYTNYNTGGTNDLTIPAASSAKAGVMTSEQYNKYLQIATYLRGYINQTLSYDTITDFRVTLNNMQNTAIGRYGRFVAIVSEVKVFVSFVRLGPATYAQWVEGPVMKGPDGDLYLNNELGVHLVGRVYNNGAWGLWRSTILDDELPLPASATNDGLMSKEDYALLQKIKAQLNL